MNETLLQVLLLIPIVGGWVYGILCTAAAPRFFRRQVQTHAPSTWPKITVLKPIHGLEKNLETNLRSACMQDYPDYQVVLSVQRQDDPARPILTRLEQEFGPDRVSVVAVDSDPVVNGKVQNLIHALTAARHEILVISDSDVLLRPDYLKTIVAPLSDPEVGYACTLYRACRADTWFERFELLGINADFTAGVILAQVTGAADFCPGSSLALRRSTLEMIGGFESLADYLVEDYELGRRILAKGFRMSLASYLVDLVVDLKSPGDWWSHQLYWDQNTRAARPIGFLGTVLTRSVPFALLFAAVRFFDFIGLLMLTATLGMRIGTTAMILKRLDDREGVRALALLPLRDLVGLASWAAALTKRSFVWRGLKFGLTRDGRILPRS
jgi:ceramide glucosyltransferase